EWLQSSHRRRNGKPCAHALVIACNDAACEGDAIGERRVVPLDEREIQGRLRLAGGIRRVYRRRVAEKRHDCIHSKTSGTSSQAQFRGGVSGIFEKERHRLRSAT